MLTRTFRTFSENKPLLESTQEAKDYLIKKYAISKGIKTSEVPEEERQKILNDPRFTEVKRVSEPFRGNTPIFTKFVFDQGASIRDLEEIVNLMRKYPNNVPKDLSMSLKDFGNTQPIDGKPGYQILLDELREIPKRITLRKFYNGLIPRMKAEFDKATEDDVKRMVKISNELEELAPREGQDMNGNFIKETAWEWFITNGLRYDDIALYPEYKDPRVAFLSMLDFVEGYIECWDRSEAEFLKMVKDLGLNASILYNKNRYSVIAARNAETIRKVAGDTNWCIKSEGQFWSYSGDKSNEYRLQLIFSNRNLPPTDSRSLVGITLAQDKSDKKISVSASFDRPNRAVPGKDPVKLFKFLDGSQDLIDVVMERLPVEFMTKTTIEEISKEAKEGGITMEMLAKRLMTVRKSSIQSNSMEAFTQTVQIIKGIIQDSDIPRDKIIGEFKESGIVSDVASEIFDTLVGYDKCPLSDLKIIKEKTEKLINQTRGKIFLNYTPEEMVYTTKEQEVEKALRKIQASPVARAYAQKEGKKEEMVSICSEGPLILKRLEQAGA